MEICKQQSEIEMRHLPVISIYGYVGGRQIKSLWETNLRSAGISGICMSNPSLVALVVPRSQRSYGQTDMARSTRLSILIKNICTLWGRKRFILPVTYFLTNLVYPFTLPVTGIKII